MKKLDINFIIGDKFFTVEKGKLTYGIVDKIEMFKDYFRYVNERSDENECLTNWFTNEQIDNEPKLKDGESQMARIFTTAQKCLDSKYYKKERIYYLENEIEKLSSEITQLKVK